MFVQSEVDSTVDASGLLAQDRPVSYATQDGAGQHSIKIDIAFAHDGMIVVAGWCTDPGAELALVTGNVVHLSEPQRHFRPDVRDALGARAPSRPGFALICDGSPEGFVSLRIGNAATEIDSPIALTGQPDISGHPHLRSVFFEALGSVAIGSAEWKARLAMLPDIAHDRSIMVGCIDRAFVCSGGGGGAVTGWELHQPDAQVWAEDAAGRVYDVQRGYRWVRQDILAHNPPIVAGATRSGFLLDLPRSKGIGTVRLCGCTPAGKFALAPTPIEPIASSSRAIAEALFEVHTPRLDFPARVRAVDLAVVGRVKALESQRFAATVPTAFCAGEPPEAPEISVIVPIYGRSDMIEHQLLKMNADPDFKNRAEVIYVIDDPAIAEDFAVRATHLQAICGPSFKWVTAGDNRGFSNANNMGAAEARGKTLLFMNSDVIPIRAGWAGALADVLDQNPDIAMIAPRLLFPDGSIQHAGMQPFWRAPFSLWTNHHPLMGMDPEFDPATDITPMPLVTGACVAITRDDFDAVGGWNTDYLIGDFEDSDLCLALRGRGRGVAYTPRVELYHLERQSFIDAGEDSFRERMTLLNATLFNTRWHQELREIST